MITSSTIALAGTEYAARPRACGKFLYAGAETLYVRGVTYGTFRPGAEGDYPERAVADGDLALMAESGINAIRTYTLPPAWLLDRAAEHGIYVMVGLPWEQHVAFLEDDARCRSIEQRIRADVRACAGHPAVLCYAVGNEIPAPIVRWHGHRRIERFIERLYEAAKEEDDGALVTYVNYPSTEYLDLPFLDVVSFNVFLETRGPLEAYLARLQNIAGDRPLLMTELGLDSARNGEEAQALSLDWQLRTAFGSGCAGAFAFSWTDEWHRGGHDVDDWDFGLVDRARQPKPALKAVREAFAEVPFPDGMEWPRISVVVCSCNGARTIRECLEGVVGLEYPDFECIVVDDGSTDVTAAIAEEFDVRLIRTANAGLASARNTGLEAATGEIVAYIDDDAFPERHWLTYLADAFATTSHGAIGGPNIAPPGDGLVAECVATAPGGPSHVLLSDDLAEHIPGCNMAFRRDLLKAIGGFDPQFGVAGDDVDICWRVQEAGSTVGYSPAACVWHKRRNSVRAYFRQQRGYGRAEALLERKWPEKYNRSGHARWHGRMYGNENGSRSSRRWHIYYGTWGGSLFQSVYERTPSTLGTLPLMPEWYLLIAFFAVAAVLGFAWEPLSFTVPVVGVPVAVLPLALCVLALLASAVGSAWPSFAHTRCSHSSRLRLRAVTSFLYVVQPLARLVGRFQFGLTPWRHRGSLRFGLPWPRSGTIWSEEWRALPDWLEGVETQLGRESAGVRRGGAYDRWDVQVRIGMVGGARLRMAVEEHGESRQMLRYRVWPRWSPGASGFVLVLAGLAAFAGVEHAFGGVLVLGTFAVFLAVVLLIETVAAASLVLESLKRRSDAEPSRVHALLPQVVTTNGTTNGATNGTTEGRRLSPHVDFPTVLSHQAAIATHPATDRLRLSPQLDLAAATEADE